jgi:hypothetical protein
MTNSRQHATRQEITAAAASGREALTCEIVAAILRAALDIESIN